MIIILQVPAIAFILERQKLHSFVGNDRIEQYRKEKNSWWKEIYKFKVFTVLPKQTSTDHFLALML